MLYAARPERGLENLLKPGGIMEQLAKEMPRAHLYTCTYDNFPEHMRSFYSWCDARSKELPNITNLGSLTKQQLADVQRQCDLYVYPTAFEDTSCIAMMECMAAGLPVIASNIAALPETTKDSGAILLDLKDGQVDIEAFVKEIAARADYPDTARMQKEAQLARAPNFEWYNAANMLLAHVETIFDRKQTSDGALLRGLIRDSDIYATATLPGAGDVIAERAMHELDTCYQFATDDTFAEHYAKYYEYEKNRGVNYGPESLAGNQRFEYVAGLIGALPVGSVVLDYGCAHGHYTINLAKRFPKLSFVGIDIAASNIVIARKWAADDAVVNVSFRHGRVDHYELRAISGDGGEGGEPAVSINSFDAIVAAEVLEHVANPGELTDALAKYLKLDGTMILTTPYGPWEAQGYVEHHPWRAHLWHFERADLHDMFGHWPNFNVVVAPAGQTVRGEALGSYITTFSKPSTPSQEIDYSRKFSLLAPRQTLSVCMIVKDGETTLLRTLESVRGIADEIIIAVDKTSTDGTRGVIERFKASCEEKLWPVVSMVEIDSPLETGFAAARNASIASADGDWILWIDADEILVHADNVTKYLRQNLWEGYAVKQHHFTVDPLGVQKTDLPCRLFRNHRGVKFYGTVHEHPEKELNKGVGHVILLPDIDIAHQGYTTEEIRQGRFQRNLGLMVRDREENPNRLLGRFLWVRDLAQMCLYENKRTKKLSPGMRQRAAAGVELFHQMLADEEMPIAMLLEGLDYYSVLVTICNPAALEVGFEIAASKLNGGAAPSQRYLTKVADAAQAEQLIKRVLKEKVKNYESRYY